MKRDIARLEATIMQSMVWKDTYKVKVQLGSMFISKERLFLEDSEPSLHEEGMTAGEAHAKRLRESTGRGYPMKDNRPISNVSEGIKAANQEFRDVAATRDLRLVSQPTYRVMAEEDYIRESVKKSVNRRVRTEHASEKRREAIHRQIAKRDYYAGAVDIDPDVSVAWPEIDITKASELMPGDVIEIEHNGTYFPLVRVIKKKWKGVGINTNGLMWLKGFIRTDDFEASNISIVSVRRMTVVVSPFSMAAFHESGREELRPLHAEWEAAHRSIAPLDEYLANGGLMLDQAEADIYEERKARLDAAEEALTLAWEKSTQ